MSMQEHLEELLDARDKPAEWGMSPAQMKLPPLFEEDQREIDAKRAAYEELMSVTIGKQLDQRIASLQEQLNAACELRATVVRLGIADLKVETMRRLVY